MGIYRFVMVIEMLVVNFYISFLCSKKKKSPLLTWIYFVIFTLLLVVLLRPVLNKLPGYGSGNGIYIFVGFIYIFLLYFLYDQSLKYIFIIMCSSWIYTMIAFSLSFRLENFLQKNQFFLSALTFQTIFYLLTLPLFLRFVRRKFVYILNNIQEETMNMLVFLSLCWFILIIMHNYIFVNGSFFLLEIIIIFLTVVIAVLTYRLFYSFVFADQTAKRMSEETKKDRLTGLKNREGLYEDAFAKIENNIPFTIIFIDLDNFKSVNDNFGHAVGDAYLLDFTDSIKKLLSGDQSIYRLAGDEFVILYEGNGYQSFCRSLTNIKFSGNKSGLKFKGLSLGCSFFPEDGYKLSALFHKADIKMYQEKKLKHKNGY